MKAKALYGFSSELAPFAGRTPEEQVAILRSWGCTVVFGGYRDPAFVAAAHAADMPVYAEYGCFVGERWWNKVPQSRPITAQGAPLEPEEGYYGVNPSVPEVRQGALQGLRELVAGYGVDGVWLDFIRWPCHWEVPEPCLPQTSFDPATVRRFCQEAQIDPPTGAVPDVADTILTRHASAWVDWRCDQIISWVRQARAAVDEIRPGLTLGLFGVPWRRADSDGALLTVIGQDYEALGAYVDVFSPMVYHRMCGFAPEWIGDVTQEIARLSGKPVWPIIQSVDHPDPLPAAEYGRALKIALRHPASDGALVFTLKGALQEKKLAVTKEVFAG